jgi:hypothetical protein
VDRHLFFSDQQGSKRANNCDMKLRHELWEEYGLKTFCLAGPDGDDARKLLGPTTKLIWTAVDAASHFEAMTEYYKFMNWGEYTTDQEWDRQPYPDKWDYEVGI